MSVGPRARRRRAKRAVVASIGVACVVGAHAAAAEDDAKHACFTAHEAAQEHRLRAELQKARTDLLGCASEACPAPVARDCTQWLAEVDAAQPSIVVRARGPGGSETAQVRVSVDGQQIAERLDGRSIDLDPGEHVVRFEMDRAKPVEQTVVLRAGEKNRVLGVAFANDDQHPGAAASGEPRPALAPSVAERPPRSSIPPLAIGLGILGVAGLGGFGFFAVRARSRETALQASCSPHCADDDVNAVRMGYLAGDVSLGIGLLAIGGATWVWLSQANSTEHHVSAVVGPGSVGVAGRF